MTATEFEREKKPSAGRGLIFFIVLVLVSIGLVGFVLTMRSDEGPLVATKAPDAVPVETEFVNLTSSLTLAETYSGLVQARQTSQLGFSASGRIVAITADVGETVTRGQTLATLDTRALQARLAAAEANIVEAVAMQTLAQATLDRQTTLVERGHLSRQALDEAQAQSDAASARILASEAQADLLRVDIDLARITAPFDGTVTRRIMDNGAIAAPGAHVIELVETGVLEARIGLPPSTARSLSVGQVYQLQGELGPVSATLRAAADIVDTQQRTITAIFDLDAGQMLPSGAVVRYVADREIEERGFWVPLSALKQADRGLWAVLIVETVNGTKTAMSRPVEMIHTDGERAFVRGAVSDGDEFISDGLTRVIPGQAVRPIASDRQFGQIN